MAPRPARRLAADNEAFSDLEESDDKDRGNSVVVEGEPGADDEISDDDIDVDEDPAALDPDAEDEDPDAEDEDGAEEDPDDADEPEAVAAAPVAAGVEAFDPKDVRILALEAGNLEERKSRATETETRAKADIEAAKADMEAAQDAGNTKANIAATEKFSNAKIALETATRQLDGIKLAEGDLIRRAQALQAKAPKGADGKPDLTGTVERRQAVEPKPSTGSKLLGAFKKANPWFGDPKYKKQTDAIMRIDRGLNAERPGQKDKKSYFMEMGVRMNREFPGVYKNLDGKPVATGRRERGAGPGVPGGAGGSAGGGGARAVSANKLKLDQGDLSQMRMFGMDPDNKEHRRNWLVEKRALAAQGKA